MRAYRIRDVFQMFFDLRVLPLFIIGSLMLAVSGNALFSLFQKWIGAESKELIIIFFSSLAILSLIATILYGIIKFLSSNEIVITSHPNPEKKKGLVFLTSQEETLRQAILYHQPVLEYCWLVCTEQSYNLANTFKAAQDKKIKVEIKMINDPFNWNETKRIIEDIYAHKPEHYSDDDIITDFTGMTKPASIGAILACLANARPLQYVPAAYQAKGNHQVAGYAGDPIAININLNTKKDR
jgi:hypothetical protein